MKHLNKSLFIMLALSFCLPIFAQGENNPALEPNPTPSTIPTIPIPNTTPTLNTAVADDAINTNVQDKISSDTLLSGTNITISTVNGVVMLNGSVINQAQVNEAIRISKTVPGVRDVRSNLTVSVVPISPGMGSP